MRHSNKKKKPVRTQSSPCRVRRTRLSTRLANDTDGETMSAVVVHPQSPDVQAPEKAPEDPNAQAHKSLEPFKT